MGSVILFNAARMQEIEDNTIVSGLVDVDGHLILTRHDGTPIDAGSVIGPQPALASDAETVAGTLTTKAVSPSNLGAGLYKVLPNRLKESYNVGPGQDPNSFIANGFYSGYAWGGSLTGYSIGVLFVQKYSNDWIVQDFTNISSAVASQIHLRRFRYDGTTWSSWQRVYDTFADLQTISSSTTQPGIVELATSEETRAGTDTTRAVTPSALNDTFGNYPSFSKRSPLPLSASIRPRSPVSFGSDLSPYVPFWVTRSSAGVVTIDGVGSGAAIASNVVFAVLPAGYRPPVQMDFQISYNNVRARATVKTNGEISITGAVASTDYFSLANIKFIASQFEAATLPAGWVNLTMQNSWIADGTKVPQYAVDTYGCVWLRGRVSKAGTWAESQVIANLGSTYNRMQGIYSVFCEGAYSTMRYGLAGGGIGNSIMAGTAVVGTAMNLDGVVIVPDAIWVGQGTNFGGSNFSHPMGDIPYVNSWQNYNAALFRTGGIWKRPDGLVITAGLLNLGTIGLTGFTLPEGTRPFVGAMFETNSSMAVSRVDFSKTNMPAPGAVVLATGSNAFYSLEGLAYNAGN